MLLRQLVSNHIPGAQYQQCFQPRVFSIILGATGKQGGSVVDVVFAHLDLKQKYALRGITSDPASSKSQALVSQGVEMVKAELNDVESLKTAVAGLYGVFGVTDFWAVMSEVIEIQQGKTIFDACKAAGVKRYVWPICRTWRR